MTLVPLSIDKFDRIRGTDSGLSSKSTCEGMTQGRNKSSIEPYGLTVLTEPVPSTSGDPFLLGFIGCKTY